MLSGEGGRGLCFLAVFGFGTVYCVGIVRAFDGGGGAAAPLHRYGGVDRSDIWSIVLMPYGSLKVNNLAFRDKNRTSLNLIRPYINRTDYL